MRATQVLLGRALNAWRVPPLSMSVTCKGLIVRVPVRVSVAADLMKREPELMGRGLRIHNCERAARGVHSLPAASWRPAQH